MLKMIWTLTTPGYSIAFSASSIRLDADAVVADLAGRLQPVERVERLRMVIEVGRRAVELDEVERLDLEVFQAAVDPAAEVLVTVAGDGLLRQAAAGLGRDEHVGAPARRFQDLGDDPFRAAVAIDVGGVDEGDAGVERGVERRDRVAFLDLAPASADRPGAEADLADAAAGASEFSRLHYGFTHFPLALDDLTDRLDEGEAFDAVVDGREVDALRRLLARARGFDRRGDFGIDVGEALEIALRMARRHAGHARRRLARARTSAGDDLGRLLVGRPEQLVRVLLPPDEPALGPVDAQHHAVLVADRDLARPQGARARRWRSAA